MKNIIKIFNELSEIEYGSLNIQTLKPLGNDSDASHMLVCKPDDLLKYKQGTCWDQSLYIYDRLKSSYTVCVIACWISLSEMNCTGHTAVAVKLDKWFWVETAWNAHKGIHAFNSSEDILNEIKKFQPQSKASLYLNNVNAAYDALLNYHGMISGKDFIGTVFGKVPILKNGSYVVKVY